MLKKQIIIKKLILLVVVGIVVILCWELNKEVGKKRHTLTEIQPTSKKQEITTFTEINVKHFDTSTWNTYKNEEYGFEIRYPKQGIVKYLGTDEWFLEGIHNWEFDIQGDDTTLWAIIKKRVVNSPTYSDSEDYKKDRVELYNDNIFLYIFPSFKDFHSSWLKEGIIHPEKIKEAKSLEEWIKSNWHIVIEPKDQKVKIGKHIGIAFWDRGHFPLLPPQPSNLAIIFTSPKGRIFWFFIPKTNNFPQIEVFYQVLSTLEFLD